VQRTLKFVKYLPLCGWQPVVHTVSNPFWPLRDPTLLAELPPSVHVYRTPTFEFERLVRRTDGLLWRAQGNGDRNQARTPSPPTRGLLTGVLKALGEGVMRHVLVPDPQIAWVPGAFLRSVHLIRKERPALLYTSAPPNSCQLLGLLLKRAFGLPWVADFRDPWTQGIRHKKAYAQSAVRRRLEETFERAVIRHADHIVVTTDKTREQFVSKYSWTPREKYSVITNGFDPADFAAANSERAESLLDPADFNVTCTGNIEAMFDALPFLGALKALLDEDEEIAARLRVNLVGAKRGKYDAYIRDNGLERNVRYLGYVPHQTSLRYLVESDVLFLCQIPVLESAGTKLPGKLFEYLYLRKPILGLTLPGPTTEILSRSGLGVTVDPSDQAGIKKTLRDLYAQWRDGQGPPAVDEAFVDVFDRSQQSRRLAGLFDGVAGGRSEGTR